MFTRISKALMKLKPDPYITYARFLPAILSALPLFVLWFFLAREAQWKDFLNFIISLKFLGSISLSAVFLYGYSEFIRITSKHFERKYFTSKRGFPTTYFMLYGDQTYSADYKTKFRERVNKTLRLETLEATGEIAQPQEAIARLNEAFNHIRLKVGKGKLVLKHNIWYGFSRNLIGGSIYGAIFCIAEILLGWLAFSDPKLVIVAGVLLLVYSTVLIFKKAILVQNGEAYARQLISEFMASAKSPKEQ
jgi:hypothetical protein